LLDDSLFNLWKQGLVEEEEVLYKAHKRNELFERIENAKKGIFDDDEEEEEEENADNGLKKKR
jgi:twitching motility protein PilT